MQHTGKFNLQQVDEEILKPAIVMKIERSHKNPALRLIAFSGAILAALVSSSRADDAFARHFDTSAEVTPWRYDFGSITPTIAFDSTMDANAVTNSGSMKLTIVCDATHTDTAVTLDLSPLVGTNFVTMECDVRVDPSSPASGGVSGYLQMVVRNGGGYTYSSQLTQNVSPGSSWVHLRATPLTAPFNDVHAITLKFGAAAGVSGTVILNIDNLRFTTPPSTLQFFVLTSSDQVTTPSGNGAGAWRPDYNHGTDPTVYSFEGNASLDSTLNPYTGNPNDGSLQVDETFTPTSYGEVITTDFNPTLAGVASNFNALEFDLKIDPASAADSFGNSVYFQIALRGAGYVYLSQFQGNVSPVPTNGGWRHFKIPITGDISTISALTVDPYDDKYTNSGNVTFYLDNIALDYPAPSAVIPPPSMFIEPPKRGLRIFGLGVSNREMLGARPTTGLSFSGAAQPVTYSVTIGDYPGTNASGLQTMILVTTGGSGVSTYADYNDPNVVFLDIQNQANGSAIAAFRYKTNAPTANSFLYAAGTLGFVSAPSAAGTWSMTLDSAGNITLNAPGGGTLTTNLPAGVAASFADPAQVYVGCQANNNGVVGQAALLTDFSIKSGASTLLEDNFASDTTLDTTTTWDSSSVHDPGAAVLVNGNAAIWIGWTLPASGFAPQANSDLTQTSWVDMSSFTPTITSGASQRLLLQQNDIAGLGGGVSNTNQVFFRMKK